jgi:hypothetical protein
MKEATTKKFVSETQAAKAIVIVFDVATHFKQENDPERAATLIAAAKIMKEFFNIES